MSGATGLPLSVHICTRNRPRSIRQLLNDLQVVLDGFAATVTVYDDSTTEASRQACQAVCANSPLGVRYFDEHERQTALAAARVAIPSAEACLDVSRPLGSPGWDLAGVRFTAMLHGALNGGTLRSGHAGGTLRSGHAGGTLRSGHAGRAAHLFLDDDIRLADCRYAGRSFRVDGAAVAKAIRAEAEGGGMFAAGAPFLGRADLSALEHFEAFLDDVSAGEPRANASPSFPAVVAVEPHVHPDGPGISGGFMVTTTEALRAAPLSRSYNEDWLWLRQLALAGGTIREMDVAVVHAGPPRSRLSAGGLFLQFEGEVLDLALALALALGGTSADRFVDEAFATCAARLDTVLRRARRMTGQARSIAAGVGALEGAWARVQQASPARYAERLAAHLGRTPRWREGFAALG